MGMSDRTRAALGTFRAFPTLNRRVLRLEEQASQAANVALLEELNQRTVALSRQVEHLQSLIEQAEPQTTLDIVTGVRDQVRDLAVELTDQANRTSALLASLSHERVDT
jgi:hypothetical protein